MASKTELDAAGQAAHAMQANIALIETQQEIRQLVDAIIAAEVTNVRFQAVSTLEILQHQFIELVVQVKRHSSAADQCSIATSRCTFYDGSANQKAAECLRLERMAGLQDAYQSVKPYGRFHPRYTLSS